MRDIDYRKISSFDAEDRLENYRKDPFDENILEIVNESLYEVQNSLEEEIISKDQPNHPIILIIGLPRSGTTLLNQILAKRFEVGYISNLIARFHKAPAIGAFLHKQLLGDRIKNLQNFESVHGATIRIEEPHEFGYFWSRHLIVNEELHEPNAEQLKNLSIEKLEKELLSLTSIFKQPVVMKCPLGIFFIPKLLEIKNLFFLILERNLAEIACSIFETRKKRLGSEDKWWSIRPINYRSLINSSPINQVAGQVEAMQESLKNGLKKAPDLKVYNINYNDLLSDPAGIMNDIQKTISTRYNIKLKDRSSIEGIQLKRKSEYIGEPYNTFSQKWK